MWNPKSHYRIHENQPFVPIVIYVNTSSPDSPIVYIRD